MFKRNKMTKEMKDKMLQMWEESVQKQLDYEKLESSPLNYGIIQDLINTASQNVRIEVTLVDGSKLIIKPETPFERAFENPDF